MIIRPILLFLVASKARCSYDGAVVVYQVEAW